MNVKNVRIIIVLVFLVNTMNVAAFNLIFNPLAGRLSILDQISKSLSDFFLIPHYSVKLKNRFSFRYKLNCYKLLRNRRQLFPLEFIKNHFQNNIFAPSPKVIVDDIMDAYFTSFTQEEAIDKLKPLLMRSEIRLLTDVFCKCSKAFDFLESNYNEVMQYNLQLLRNCIDQEKIASHLQMMRAFYDSPERALKSISLVWSPSSEMIAGRCYGDHLILYLPDVRIQNDNEARSLVSVLVHEATHHISGCASEEQKKQLTQVFLQQVNSVRFGELSHYTCALEEPLVVASQLLFIKNNFESMYEKSIVDFGSSLSLNLLSLLEEYIEKKKSIDEDFVKRCAIFFNTCS